MNSETPESQIRSLTRKSLLIALLCLPVIIWQALRLNHRVLRVPEADGLSGHIEGRKPALRLLLLGESTSAGVGVSHNANGLAGHLATALARQLECAVHWRVIGLNGYTVKQTRTRLCPQVASGSADLVILVHGFNDTVNWTTPRRWKNEIQQIISILDTRLHRARFILTGIPPFRHFPLLPEPMRSVLGLRADALEMASLGLVDEIQNLQFVKLEALPASDFYCIDSFHPSDKGYELWASKLVPLIVQ